MSNIYIQDLNRRRYAEIFKPIYKQDQSIPLDVVNCGSTRVFAQYISEVCNHKGFVFMFGTGGSGEIIIENKSYTINKGDVICYRSSNSRVTVKPTSDLWTYKWIEIKGSTSTFYYSRINALSFPLPFVTHLSDEVLLYHYNRICNNLSDTSNAASYRSNSFLTELLSYVLVQLEDTGSYKDRFSENFSTLFSYLEKNYFTEITTEKMADIFSLSKYHFIRIFKEYLGITPMKYVRNLRIAKASELLIRTDRTVEEIAEIVGYSTTTGFIDNFKAVQGTTPLKYRKKGM